jgi:hypothetical protein
MKSLPLILTLALMGNIPGYSQPDFTAYTAGNPVVPRGSTGAWDRGTVWAPTITVANDTFYLIYNGTINFSTQPSQIGLATSTDGRTFTKSPNNPILSGDGSGFDSYTVIGGPLFFDNGIWYLYYGGLSSQPNFPRPGNIISRATADNPHGPWIRTNDTLMTTGSNGEWDDKFICPTQILITDTGLVMYYWASDDWYPSVFKCQIGMATSVDGGETWQKYDEPATTSSPYTESDPIVKAGPESYDNSGIFGVGVVRNGAQWEMFYNGISSMTGGSICYANSPEGIIWQKDTTNNPIYTFWDDPLALASLLESSAVTMVDSTYFLYYDYGFSSNSAGIGLATDPPIVGIEQPVKNKISGFILNQNYPNPFNACTNIEFQIPKSEFVTLKIYNLLGEEVCTLLCASLLSGFHSYKFDASNLPGGVYLYKLKAGKFIQTRKALLLK